MERGHGRGGQGVPGGDVGWPGAARGSPGPAAADAEGTGDAAGPWGGREADAGNG